MLHLICPERIIVVLDIKGACLQVPQQEEVLVTIPSWMKKVCNIGEGVVWRLKRCLPGQRNAATRWYEHLRSILEKLGFVFSVHVPLARHVKRRLCISIHVDDELLAGEKQETVWLVEELEKIFKVEKEGPYPSDRIGRGEEMRYLKRKYVFVPEGIVVQPNEKYVRKLIELYDLGRLKSKATPEHIDLVKEDKSKELGPEETKRFRSGLESILLCQLQDWVRDNIVKLGTVKTALNVADLNTTKLSCARRAFLLYHLSQVEYFEGEEIVRTGEDEYDKYEQEKRLKEYVGGNQVKNLIRLIQVFSVIRPSTASWIKGSPVAVETGEASGNSHTMERLDITYILLVIAVAVLIVPRMLEAWKRITKLIARMSTVGMLKIHSGSRNKVFHKETCRYAAKSATGVSNVSAQGKRLDMYGAHAKAVSESMQQRSGEQPTTRLQMKEPLETIAGTKAMREDRQKDKVERGCKEKAAYESVERQVEAEQQSAMEGTIGQGTVSGQERLPEILEDTYEDQVSTNTNEEERIVSTNTNEEERIVHNGQEMTLEEMGRQPLPDVVQEHYEDRGFRRVSPPIWTAWRRGGLTPWRVFSRGMSTFKVKVPDGALEHLLSSSSASWIPSKSRLLQFPGRDDLLEELLRRLLTKATKLAGEPLIPLKCVLCRYDDNQGSCELHSHPLQQLTLALGAERPLLLADTALMLPEGRAVRIEKGVPHGVPEQHSPCGPRLSLNLFVASKAEASSPPLSLLPGPLEPSTQLCAFRWARPTPLDASFRPQDGQMRDLWLSCTSQEEGTSPSAKRRRQATVPSELPADWGVDGRVALDFAGLSAGAREVCFERLRKVFEEGPPRVRDINRYCSTVIKGVGDSFGSALPAALREALEAKLAGSGWTLGDLDSSAIGALAGLPEPAARQLLESLRPASVSNLSAFVSGAAKRLGAQCPLAQALGKGWPAVAKVLAKDQAVGGQGLVKAIALACQQQTPEAFEAACAALSRFPAGCKPPLSTYNTIFKVAGRVGRWPKALELFSQLPEHLQPNRYTYTALFDAVVKGGGPESVLWALWNQLQRSRAEADLQLMSTMLQGCSDASVVEELLGELDWQGLTPNMEVLTSMLGCLRRAGAATNKTWEVLKLAKSCELTLDCQFLVQVVTALGFANDTGAVVLLMESVREVYKVEPDVFLYTAAIAQCARAGDVAGAETLLRLMQRRDQVEPNEHTHCAIIAVYSKAGKLLEAVRHFQEANEKVALPIEGYTSILSGCRAALDNRCAMHILKKARLQGPVKSACYTLARQSCALAGDEAGAAKVDKWQKQDGVVTHVPTSTVDDPSTGERLPFQPGNDDVAVAACVQRMMSRLKSAGYEPQLWQYDPEISQEEREDRLQFHTEKKALAWALKHFPKGSSITVRKTIRLQSLVGESQVPRVRVAKAGRRLQLPHLAVPAPDVLPDSGLQMAAAALPDTVVLPLLRARVWGAYGSTGVPVALQGCRRADADSRTPVNQSLPDLFDAACAERVASSARSARSWWDPSGRRSTIRPCSLPLLLLVLANAHGESCSGETSHGEGCSGEASSLLARKLETHPASTANDMTDDQKEHALRDVEEEASIFPDNATDGNTSGFGPLASRMEFIFLKLAQLETVVELQQVEIQEPDLLFQELKACGVCAKHQSTSAVEAKAKQSDEAQAKSRSRHAPWEVLKSVLRKHGRQLEQREFATPTRPSPASKVEDAGLDPKESADSASFIGKSATDSAELAVDHLLSAWYDIGFGHNCAWSAPGLEISKEKIKMTMGRQKCELKITGKTYTIFDLKFDAVEVQWPEPLKSIISILDCSGKDALQCLGIDIIQKVPPFNFLTKMDNILVEFIQVFARIASSMAKTVTLGKTSMIQAAVRSEFPAVGAAPVLHHSASNLQIRTHTQHAHSQHVLSRPKRKMSTLQEGGDDDDDDKKLPRIVSVGFSASDASYRSKLITQFDGNEFDTSSCLAFAPKTRSGVNNLTRIRMQDWQVKGDPNGFIQLEPFAVPCSPTFLQNHWDKWQGYSVYGWNLPVERCLTLTYGWAMDPVLSFAAGLSFSFLKEFFSFAISVCWPDFMPGGFHITSITAQARFLGTMVASITFRNTRHRFRPDGDLKRVWENTHVTWGSVMIPWGLPRDSRWQNTRGLEPFPRSWLQNGSNTRQAQQAQNISQTGSDDTGWATHVEDLYLASVEAGDGLNITKTSELRGEEVLQRMAAMSVLQDSASSTSLLEDNKIDLVTSFKFGDFGVDSGRLRLFDIADLTRDILTSMNLPSSEIDKAVSAMSNITSNDIIKRVPPPMIKPGYQIALKNKLHRRYVRMSPTGVDANTQDSDTNQDADDLTWERFTVVDAGNGLIALHCTAYNRFLRMTDSKVDASPVRAISDLTADWLWERFRVVELANNQIALHSPAHNRFLSVSHEGFVSRSEQTAWNQLPANWQWERLSVVQLNSSLQPGNMVALHNAKVRRFLNMNHQGDMGCSGQADANSLPALWTWEQFIVVDAGNGTIALHSVSMNRFVKMSGSDMTGSPLQDASPFPSSFTNEIFSVRYFPNSGGEEVALHNAKHNRFVRMTENGGWCGVDTSAQTNLQDLTLDDAELKFKVLKIDGPTKASDAVRPIIRCTHAAAATSSRRLASATCPLWRRLPRPGEGEEREDRLHFHTEKKGSSITVRKTIRCCVDCHNAFKVALQACGRTLRILDQAHQHELTTGNCS
eukprot:s2616_g2.t2